MYAYIDMCLYIYIYIYQNSGKRESRTATPQTVLEPSPLDSCPSAVKFESFRA